MNTWDVAIVLGHYDNRKGLTFRQIKRLEIAVELERKNKVGYIITTGRPGLYDKKTPMGSRMKGYLIEQNVKAEKILEEKEAANTLENARNSLVLVKHHNFTSIVVITSFPHIFRAKRIFHRIFPSNMRIDFIISDFFAEPLVTVRDLVWELFAWIKFFFTK